MLPDPLHPAVVHLPIALAVLIPGLAILTIFLILKGFPALPSWGLLVLLQATLVGSAWLALETGERQEERVERVVAERHIEAHEEAAKRLFLLAAVGLVASATGLLPRRAGSAGRVVTALVALGLLAAGISAGRSGGELVYKHGAADAYLHAADARSDAYR